MRTLQHYIDGIWQDGDAVRVEDIPNPATGAVLARLPHAPPSLVDAAVTAAARAFPRWRETPVVERSRILFRYRELLEDHAAGLARLVTDENGKTLAEAAGEVRRGIEWWSSRAGHRRC